MIRKTVLIAGLALATTFSIAQAPATGDTAKPHRGHGQHQQLTQDQYVSKRLARMNEKLQLSQDQQSKLSDVLKDEWTKQNALRTNTSLTQEQQRTQMKELRKNERQQIDSILTPEQREKAKEMHKKDGKRGEAKKRMGFMARELDLTDAQKAQLKPMFQEQREKMQALKANTSLTQEQKREQFKQLREDGRKQFLAVLTPQQQQKLRDMRSRHTQQQQANPGPGF
jgi:Spy/CpxP family protein refolding chaperone